MVELFNNVFSIKRDVIISDTTVESCGSVSPSLDGYYIVVPEGNKDKFFEYLISVNPGEVEHLEAVRSKSTSFPSLLTLPLLQSGFNTYTEFLLSEYTPEEVFSTFINVDVSEEVPPTVEEEVAIEVTEPVVEEPAVVFDLDTMLSLAEIKELCDTLSYIGYEYSASLLTSCSSLYQKGHYLEATNMMLIACRPFFYLIKDNEVDVVGGGITC